MKIEKILLKTLLLSLIGILLITPTLLGKEPQNQIINLSSSYDWVSIWSRFDDRDDMAIDVGIDDNDNIIFGGISSNTTMDLFITKFDEFGNQLWNATLNGGSQDWFRALAVNGTEIYVANDYYNPSLFRSEFMLIKYDNGGNYLWNKTWFKEDATGCYAQDMVLSQSGNFYVTGEMAYGSNYKYFLLKLDANGNEVWNVTFGQKNTVRKIIFGISSFEDLIYIVGQFFNQATGANEPLILSFNAITSLQLWNKTWSFPSYYGGQASDVVVDDFGNIYVTGFYGVFSNRLLFVRKYNPFGSVVWSKNFQYMASIAQGITLEDNTNIYIAGSKEGDYPESSALLINYDCNGTLLGFGTWEGSISGNNVGKDVIANENGNVYMVGYTPGVTMNDAFIIKNLELELPRDNEAISGFELISFGIVLFSIIIIQLFGMKKHFQ